VVHNQGKEFHAMSLIKEVKLPATRLQKRVQNAVWLLIYVGLLTLITGYTMGQIGKTNGVPGWATADTLMLLGSLGVALGVVLIYIRSRMK
jgi:DMSO reductase anchor subunit